MNKVELISSEFPPTVSAVMRREVVFLPANGLRLDELGWLFFPLSTSTFVG